MDDDTDSTEKPNGKPFSVGREKTGGRKAGVGNRFPSAKKVRRRVLAQVHDAMARHAGVVAALYAKEPLEAAKLDARVNRDCLELLQVVDRLAEAPKPSAGEKGSVDTLDDMTPAQIAELVRSQPPITAEESARMYQQLINAPAGSDAARVITARFAVSDTVQLGQIAERAGVELDVVRKVLDACEVTAPPAPAPRLLPAPESPKPEPVEGEVMPRQPPPPALRASAKPEPDWSEFLRPDPTWWQRGY